MEEGLRGIQQSFRELHERMNLVAQAAASYGERLQVRLRCSFVVFCRFFPLISVALLRSCIRMHAQPHPVCAACCQLFV